MTLRRLQIDQWLVPAIMTQLHLVIVEAHSLATIIQWCCHFPLDIFVLLEEASVPEFIGRAET